ncbi:MAG: hypothetical protein ABIQ44_09575 [Chloroflexia bacterium]
MTPELAAFSDWVLALLPRLFLFPGGLWMLVGLTVIRFALGGLDALRPRRLASDLAQVNLGSAAIAWAAISLLPLPGTAALPAPVDRWVLVAMLSVSLLLSIGEVEEKARIWFALAGAGIALALLGPMASTQRLLTSDSQLDLGWNATPWALSVGLGIVALYWLGEDRIESQLRWLAWGSMALMPALIYLPDSWLMACVVFPVMAGVIGFAKMRVAGVTPAPRPQLRLALFTQWLLVLGALLALLFAR